MKKHALGDQGLQVSLFPEASIKGRLINMDFQKKTKQHLEAPSTLTVHDVKAEVMLQIDVTYENEQWLLRTRVPVDRNIFKLNGKKANSIDDIVYVDVLVELKGK